MSKIARASSLWVAAFVAALMVATPAYAYIGPGAGFALIGSSFVFVGTAILAVVTILTWPFIWLYRAARGFGVPRDARARRIVIVGLDGLEPKITEQMMEAGELPNLAALKQSGDYTRLGTTLPALSPVAWSSFQTGVNPGAHNIFDFLTRDKRRYLPVMASTEQRKVSARGLLKLIGLAKDHEEVQITRRSKPFWKILGERGITSNIVRVPISYPPEPFYGNILSAMCTPDLKGTQGSFSFFSTKAAEGNSVGGQFRAFRREGASLYGEIDGPPAQGGGHLKAGFELVPDGSGAILIVNGQRTKLLIDRYSEWQPLEFKIEKSSIKGIVRFCLRSASPEVTLYVTPVNVHPEFPALPIAAPIAFAKYLAKKQGLFGTLGLMEDTWGRNEHAINDDLFLAQSYLAHEEREKMFFDSLKNTTNGVIACVFDASDRIQHIFWRYLDKAHPAEKENNQNSYNTIHQMYKKMDDLVGRIKKQIKPSDILVVMSDHGFASFRRCIGINAWLHQNGYLVLKDGAKPGSDYLKDVDWSKTKAFGLGLSGLYINVKGREAQGIVPTSDVAALKAEISAKLEKLTDPQDSAQTISKVYDTAKAYKGLYTADAPDLIVGYMPGYRVSWDSVTGTVESEVFSDNLKAWSGDHHVDPELVPGVLFCSRKLTEKRANIVDIAPSVLSVFKQPIPKYMEGKVIF
jgi:predicted AlkP superfamily phosphohydrolase/phosphomutase